MPEAGTRGDRKEGADARGRTSQSKTRQDMQLAGDRGGREKSPRDGKSQPQCLEGNSVVNRNGEPGKGSSPKEWFVAGHVATCECLSRTHPAGGCTGGTRKGTRTQDHLHREGPEGNLGGAPLTGGEVKETDKWTEA